MADDLISSLEATGKGGQQFDAQVAKIVDPDGKEIWWWVDAKGALRAFAGCPHFTTSLDAALTLVPEGWYWSVTHTSLSDYRGPMAFCWKRDVANIMVHAAIPALALCIAALKARAVEGPE